MIAEVLPDQEEAQVAALQARGLSVATAGDGDGDAPAPAGYRTMLQNLAWAGVTPPPAVGAILMSAATIVAALNAQLLRRLDLRPYGSA